MSHLSLGQNWTRNQEKNVKDLGGAKRPDNKKGNAGNESGFGRRNPSLSHVLATALFVSHLTLLIGLIKQHLSHAFIGINLGRQRRGIGKFQSDMAFPLWLQWRDVNDNAAARIGGFAQTNCKYVFGNAEILYRPRQRERIWRNYANRFIDTNKAAFVKILWVNYIGRMHVGEDFKFTGTAHVITVARSAVGNDLLFIKVAHLPGFKRFDHALG